MVDRLSFMIIMIVLIFLTLPKGPDQVGHAKDQEVLQTFRNVLTKATTEMAEKQYYMGYGNLTGLRLSYQDSLDHRNASHWPFREYTPDHPWLETQQDSVLPTEISSRVKKFWGTEKLQPDAAAAYLLNVSGSVYGEFSMATPDTPLQPIDMLLPPYLAEYYELYTQASYEQEKQRYEEDPENNSPPQERPERFEKVGNITDYTHGLVHVEIESFADTTDDFGIPLVKPVDGAVLVRISVIFKDHPETDVNKLDLFGVYFQDTGSLVAITKSAKFMGTHALPQFLMLETNHNRTRAVVQDLLAQADVQKNTLLEDLTRLLDRSQQECEMVTYLQFKKTQFLRAELSYIDDELKAPQGLPLPKTLPELEIQDAVFYSPDCGVYLEKNKSVPLTGPQLEVSIRNVRIVLIWVLMFVILELALTFNQTRNYSSPSHLANISSWCVAMLSFHDVFAMVLAALTLWSKDWYLLRACLVALCGSTFYLFGARYLKMIHLIQANERGTTWRELLRGSREENDQAPPAAVPSPADDSGNMFSYLFAGFVGAFVAMYVVAALMMARRSVRGPMEYVCFLAINSYWFPQFVRNTIKNRRRSLSWDFILGTSFIRVLPVAYLCLDTANPVRHGWNPRLISAVVAWVGLQLFLLYLQSQLGPRFWVNERWLPKQYNYHPLMSVADIENGFSADILANLKVSQNGGISTADIDCAICMSQLTIPVLTDDNTKDKRSLESVMKDCMVTPCHHVFHSRCLEDWMMYKLQCPVCRSPLPLV